MAGLFICCCMAGPVAAEHQLSLSGAAHHLLRLGAGLEPLLPLTSSPSTLNSKSHGD